MKRFSVLGLGLCIAATLSYGESWTAKLLDGSCYENRKTTAHEHEGVAKACAPGATTKNFAFITTNGKLDGTVGKVYKIDGASSAKIASDIQNGVLKPTENGEIHAVVNGTLKHGVVSVNSLDVDPKKGDDRR